MAVPPFVKRFSKASRNVRQKPVSRIERGWRSIVLKATRPTADLPTASKKSTHIGRRARRPNRPTSFSALGDKTHSAVARAARFLKRGLDEAEHAAAQHNHAREGLGAEFMEAVSERVQPTTRKPYSWPPRSTRPHTLSVALA